MSKIKNKLYKETLDFNFQCLDLICKRSLELLEDEKKIILSDNFRSRKGVCDAVNFFFNFLFF